MQGERELLREWLDLRYKDLVDSLELMASIATSSKSVSGSEEIRGKEVFLNDSWKILPEAYRILGIIEAYTTIFEDIEPEIEEYKETNSRNVESMKEKLEQITLLYAEAENHYHQKYPRGDVEI